MRTLTYSVRTNKGETFTTTSFAEATKEGNSIVKTYLVETRERNEKMSKIIADRASKILAKLGVRE